MASSSNFHSTVMRYTSIAVKHCCIHKYRSWSPPRWLRHFGMLSLECYTSPAPGIKPQNFLSRVWQCNFFQVPNVLKVGLFCVYSRIDKQKQNKSKHYLRLIRPFNHTSALARVHSFPINPKQGNNKLQSRYSVLCGLINGCWLLELVTAENRTKHYLNTYTAKPVYWREWISDSCCSLKPLCSGMGEVVPARTSPTLLPPSPRTVLSLSCFKVLQCINCHDWHCKS